MLLAAGGFSQAFISVQISLKNSLLNKRVGQIIAIQTIVLSGCAAIIVYIYKVGIYFGFINSGYEDLQIKLFICLAAIVVSAPYFITVPAYSLSGKSGTLVCTSMLAITMAVVVGAVSYSLLAAYFPYIFFAVFFVTRGIAVSSRSGYSWSDILWSNRHMFIISITVVVLFTFVILEAI